MVTNKIYRWWKPRVYHMNRFLPSQRIALPSPGLSGFRWRKDGRLISAFGTPPCYNNGRDEGISDHRILGRHPWPVISFHKVYRWARIVDRALVANILDIVIHKFINPPLCSFSRLYCSGFHAIAGCTRDSDYAMLSLTIAERKNIDSIANSLPSTGLKAWFNWW